MREVQVVQKDEGPSGSAAVLRQTLTWYDNLDRVRFTAEYGRCKNKR